MKAKKLFTTYGQHSNVVTYEYRGRLYDVEYARDWTFCTTPAKLQHQYAQEKIDAEIERESNGKKNDSGHPVDLDEIWDLMGWD